jgi:predicted protein tyrosine phosphatase
MIKAIYAISRVTIANPVHSDLSARGSGKNLLISINTYPDGMLITKPGHVKRLIKLGYIDHLSLVFGDITAGDFQNFRMTGNNEAPGFKLFSYDDARAIKKFVDQWKFEEIDRLVVHCDKGQSRSGAVAAWAQYYLTQQGLYGRTANQFWADNREIAPNRYVAQVLCEVSGMVFKEDDY